MRLPPALASALALPSGPAPDWAAGAGLWGLAIGVALRRQAAAEWRGSPLHLLLIGRLKPEGLGAAPRDFRPVASGPGKAILGGSFQMAGAELRLEPGEEPWSRPSPSRRFAAELHQFGWLRDLVRTGGEAGLRESLRLLLAWTRIFGRWNAFAWSPEILERRVYNLACALRQVGSTASDAERSFLARSLARQALHLSGLRSDAMRAAERQAAVAAAGAALLGSAGDSLLDGALGRLERILPVSVLPDGGHASRSPEAALQLLLDLLTVDDALLQLGREPPEELARAVDRLTGALRMFTLPDGRLICAQGGQEGDPGDIAAARAHDEAGAPAALQAPHSGYESLAGGSLRVVVDAGPPAPGAWSLAACAHPLALEVLCGRDRMITNSGWGPVAETFQPLRLTPAGSTVSVGDASAGAPLQGYRARALGPRLVGGATVVDVRRHAAEDGTWLELSHDGWAERFGLTHERRLFLDAAADELRGEDRLVPRAEDTGAPIAFAARFHIHPDVKASLARDQRSVLLQGPTTGGWWLRNDAREVAIEPSMHLVGGRSRRSVQVVLRSHLESGRGGRIRWKLARVGPDLA